MAKDSVTALEDTVHGLLADHVNTHLEGRIVAYKNGRVDVKPIGNKNYTDGDSLEFPVLHDLPLCWLAGDNGEAGVKIPVKVGDKCLILFKQQPQEDGDVETTRRFSLADAHVLPGTSYPDSHPGNDNVKLYYGEAFIEITPDGVINVNAPGGFNVTAPKSTFSQQVISMGLLTYNAGMVGNGGSGVTATINGKVVITDGSSTIGGKPFNTHKHTGVTTGSGTTGNPA